MIRRASTACSPRPRRSRRAAVRFASTCTCGAPTFAKALSRCDLLDRGSVEGLCIAEHRRAVHGEHVREVEVEQRAKLIVRRLGLLVPPGPDVVRLHEAEALAQELAEAVHVRVGRGPVLQAVAADLSAAVEKQQSYS